VSAPTGTVSSAALSPLTRRTYPLRVGRMVSSRAVPRHCAWWLPLGRFGKYVGDGLGRRTLDALVMRQQLAAPTFKTANRKDHGPLKTQEAMGPYYPAGTYMDKGQFEARGCRNANS